MPPAKTPRPLPELRAQGLQLLSEGHSVAAVARTLKRREATIRDWRDSPSGRAFLDTERAKRAESIAKANVNARRMLEDASGLAAQVLLDALRAPTTFARIAAARAILDRSGVPATRELKATLAHDEKDTDFSRLTTSELLALQAIMRKVRGESLDDDDLEVLARLCDEGGPTPRSGAVASPSRDQAAPSAAPPGACPPEAPQPPARR